METLNLEVATLDEVSDTIARSAGFVIGSPTLGGHMPTQVTTLQSDSYCTAHSSGPACRNATASLAKCTPQEYISELCRPSGDALGSLHVQPPPATAFALKA